SVKRNAEIQLLPADQRLQALEVHRAATLVYVSPVGAIADDFDVRPKPAQQLGRQLAGRAVCTIDSDSHSVERKTRRNAGEKGQVGLAELFVSRYRSDRVPIRSLIFSFECGRGIASESATRRQIGFYS